MTKILTNPQGKAYISSGGKALLSTGGGSATLITKTITQNGIYNASSDNADGYSSVTVNVGGTPTGKYQLFERIKDDNNLEIGTVCGFFKDANDVEYAVVCLDAIYRATSVQWASITGNVTNMPSYNNWTIWEAPATATENTTLILDYCSAKGYTSTACTHCRQYSFVIDGTTYYGQLPNIIELNDIARHRTAINTADTSGGSITIATDKNYWSSSQNGRNSGWYMYTVGSVAISTKTSNYFACPVLEIPNALS
jgi:hypothetical protein